MNQDTPNSIGSSRPSCKSKCESESLTTGIALSQAEQSQKQKIQNHPCYSSDAHHKYARLHLPVAPACNIQCNYCNRKYDCANESRPGVVSELLTPEQALLKAQLVAEKIPQLSVIGIAGPGDPLANPERTFKTLELIRDAMPDIKLCISTNGLTLAKHVNKLKDLGVDHVTVTLNTLDEVIAAKIYDWIYLDGKRYRGNMAGRLLIEKQMEGIEALSKAGILTKINSVLIPGINDEHLPLLSQELRRNEVFLHNVMPLISKPEHGTVFGLNGQKEPTEQELDAVRENCGANVSQMKHCQQCRADAVGMLGEDRSAEFKLSDLSKEAINYPETLLKRSRFQATIASKGLSETAPSLLVAVATKSGSQVDLHFGHADCFQLYLVCQEQYFYVGERRLRRYCQSKSDCEEQEMQGHTQQIEQTIAALSGVDAVLCCRIGLGPWESLESAGITPVVDFAYEALEPALMQSFEKLKALAQEKWSLKLAQRSEVGVA